MMMTYKILRSLVRRIVTTTSGAGRRRGGGGGPGSGTGTASFASSSHTTTSSSSSSSSAGAPTASAAASNILRNVSSSLTSSSLSSSSSWTNYWQAQRQQLLSHFLSRSHHLTTTHKEVQKPFVTGEGRRSFTTTTRSNSNSSRDPQRPGLYTIPGLNYPSDFLRLTKLAIEESDRLRTSEIPTSPVSTTITSTTKAVDTLYKLDQISKTVCNVIDAAELCRSTHISEEWREAANNAFMILQDYIASLNTDRNLYEVLAFIHDNYYDQLTEEEQRFCFLLKREFELDGIHLSDAARNQVKDLHSRVTTLETLYAQNIVKCQSLSTQQKQFWVCADTAEQVIPPHVLKANGVQYNTDNETENGDQQQSRRRELKLTVDTPISNSLLVFSPHSDLRRDIYMETMTQCVENHDVLDALRDARHQLASSLEYNSYSERFLQDKMVQSPQNVIKFLTDLQQQIQPHYQKELAMIANAKQRLEGGGGSSTTTVSSTGVTSISTGNPVEAWDIKFYIKALKAATAAKNAANGGSGSGGGYEDLADELAPYLSLPNCLEAMQLLTSNLFGIRMEEVSIDNEEERWDIELNDKGQVVAKVPVDEQIRKFAFREEDSGRELGIMYLDLHPRPNKYTHAAHFTVRCGCVVDGPGSDYQLPVVALVCNMNSGHASFSSHSEVETLFHEFGHAIHSLLSRTNFQHLSGTRAAMDFVETPSHWMEHYVWDVDFLPILAKNTQGEPLPNHLAVALNQSRNQFRYIEMQSQLCLAMFDQTIFGGNGAGDDAATTSPLHIWEDIHRRHGVPFAQGTHWYTNVGHLVTYGAGYYCYLYSQVFANAIWNDLFHDGRCLSRSAGQRMWKDVLIYGGARDPNIMIEDLLGKKPTVSQLLP